MLRTFSTSSESWANAPSDETPGELMELQVPLQEWRAIITVRPNVLIEGPDCSTEKLVRALIAALDAPLCDWENVHGCEPGATLLIRHIDVMSGDEHRNLLARLNAEGAQARIRQVIVTSSRPLYPLVESGLFPADLYYRLNTIRLELGEPTGL